MFDLNVKRQYLGYKLHINGLEMDEILTYVSMYGGSSTSFLRYERSNITGTIFNLCESLQTHFRHSPIRRAYFSVKIIFSYLAICIVLQRLQALV